MDGALSLIWDFVAYPAGFEPAAIGLLSFSLVVWDWRMDLQPGMSKEGPGETIVFADPIDASFGCV
ncbi:hypothetical protein ACFWTE_19440, partial [Nocardiopsis sp. NPDC058631]|uniref:hypothetical protein n=1 Tax=Nocardiopsis sp. NPDC058631 TaxID=3346566 RepID=UPI003651B600